VTLRAVLAGAGHAHLHVVKDAGDLRRAGVEPILISPAIFRYSGLASGVLSGAIEPGEAEIDIAALAGRYSVEHIVADVEAIERGARTLALSDGGTVTFGALSLNIGSRVRVPSGLENLPAVWPVKPLEGLFKLRLHLEACFAASGRCPEIVVAGRGLTGYEIAAALAGLSERFGVVPSVTLVGPDEDVVWAPLAARLSLEARLGRRGIVIVSGKATGHSEGQCLLSSGRQMPCDILVLATGLVAPPLIGTLGLPVDAAGRLVTKPELNTVADPSLFAAGDCGVIGAAERPPAGVFGVRAATTLAGNLRALGLSQPLQSYRPQTRWLKILDLGDGTGLAMRGGLWWLGRAALALKRRIDRQFMARYRQAASDT
jgi:NADH dehydrogenase FAD-containing subunit